MQDSALNLWQHLLIKAVLLIALSISAAFLSLTFVKPEESVVGV